MTTYHASPNIAVLSPPRPPQTVRIAAFSCDGLDGLSRELGFPVAVVAAVDDVGRHARRLHDLWYASGVSRTWKEWPVPFDFDNWSYRDWRVVRFDPRWFGRSRHPLSACIDHGTLLLHMPAGVDRTIYAAAFKEGLTNLRFEAVVRHPPFVVRWHHARRMAIPASRYARASAGDPTPTEVRDLVRLTPRGFPAIADVGLATMERLGGASLVATPRAGGL